MKFVNGSCPFTPLKASDGDTKISITALEDWVGR